MTGKRILVWAAWSVSALVLTASEPSARITVGNSLPQPRTEMVEVDMAMLPCNGGILRDDAGAELPWQATYDGKLVFIASVDSSATSTYTFTPGLQAGCDTIACASFHPERMDDIAWENDYAAYRAYGPAYGRSGAKAFGYDVWTKSTTRPVVKERYVNELQRGKSYHKDHGDGMDVYDVGATLGAGATALIGKDGTLIYPGCFSEWEILDNGPLRTTIRLVFDYAGGREERVITLDAGSPLNRTTCRFSGFDADSVAAGIVVHRPMETAYELGANYLSVTDPTQSPANGNGLIYVGVVVPSADVHTSFSPEGNPDGPIAGHAIASVPYAADSEFVYLWGACWSKGRVHTPGQWHAILRDAARRMSHPLTVTVSPCHF